MTLASYMIDYLGALATELGWTSASTPVTFSVTEALDAYGVSLEADASDSVKLHAIAKVKVLQAALRETANAVNFSADSSNISLSQLNDHIRGLLSDAMQEALPYLPEYAIEVGQLNFPDDPYDRLESYGGADDDVDWDTWDD